VTLSDEAALPRALTEFCRLLRDVGGVRVASSQLIALQAAVAALGAPDLEDLYWAGRVCLAVRRHERDVYDRLFGDFWLGTAFTPLAEPRDEESGGGDQQTPGLTGPQREAAPTPVTGMDDRDGDPSDAAGAEASSIESLSLTPFASCTEEEQAILRSLIRRLRIVPPQRMSRRRRPAPVGRQLDLRRTMRASLSTQGVLLTPRWKDRRPRPRRIVMFLDVSRSMAPYSRLLLHFAHAVSVSGFEVEVICFGTRVTRVTRLIRRQRSSRALEAAAASVVDWNGGTRIGEAIRVAQTIGTVKGALRGSVVLMMSDGLEQDDPEQLATALRRLRSTCHSLVWANPLAGDPRYQPLTAGMVAALPYIDVLCAGDTLAALERVAATLGELETPDIERRALTRPR
jgi:uncharacterized protein with von Willebrand factor type A (vWA) domain